MAENYITAMMAFPPEKKKQKLTTKEYDAHIRAFIKDLTSVNPPTWNKLVSKDKLLEILDPEVNSIPYLLGLNRQIEASIKDAAALDSLLTLATYFLTTCDPIQMRYVGEQWRMLFRWVLQKYTSSGSIDLEPLVVALLRIDPSAGSFTINHLRLVRSCLQLEVPSQALPILDKTIFAYPYPAPKYMPDELLSDYHDLSNSFITPASGFVVTIHSEIVLEYYLLGACIYIGLQNYTRARLFLEYVILSPSTQHSVSALQVEAYKKWVLLGLIAEGTRYPLPRTLDAAVLKTMRSIAKPYDMLANDFVKRDWRKFQAEALNGGQFWVEDGNIQMIKDVGDALLRQRVIDLQNTYAALPISRVAKHLSLEATATSQLLDDMIQQGHLNAKVLTTDSQPILRFNSEPPSSAESVQLEEQTARIADLVTYVREADRRVQLSKEYVDHQKRAKRAAGPDGDFADAMDLTWDAPVMTADDDRDEDIMSG